MVVDDRRQIEPRVAGADAGAVRRGALGPVAADGALDRDDRPVGEDSAALRSRAVRDVAADGCVGEADGDRRAVLNKDATAVQAVAVGRVAMDCAVRCVEPTSRADAATSQIRCSWNPRLRSERIVSDDGSFERDR